MREGCLPRHKRTDTRVLVMINQLFHKRNVLIKHRHFFVKTSSLVVILEDRIQDAEDQDQSYFSLNTLFYVERTELQHLQSA